MLFEIQTKPSKSILRIAALSRISAGAIVLIAGLSGFGCRTPVDASTQDPAAWDAALHAGRLTTLRSAIERDHRTLEILIAKTERAEDGALYEDPELREIAIRLIDLKRSLEELAAIVSSESAGSK